jgi:hypothetical protein
MRIFLLSLFLASRALAGDLPDPALTPGLANPDLTKEVLCAPEFRTGPFRNVPQSRKRQAFRDYGIACGKACGKLYEVDHLISLELGGSNSIKNLWPESYSGKWNARIKDKYENLLHKLVCAGKMTLQEAQDEISSDWIAGYRLHPELP